MTITDREAMLGAASLAVAVRFGLVGAALMLGLCVVTTRGPARRSVVVVTICAICCVGGMWRSNRAWSEIRSTARVEVRGYVDLVEDPHPIGRGVRIVAEVGGRRYAGWVFGRRANRLRTISAGTRVWIAGRATGFSETRQRDAVRHIVGRLTIDAVGDLASGSPLMRSAERVRRRVADAAAATMDAEAAALFSGLVLGDDRNQSTWMVAEFRKSGLSHLTAVSGQNITLLLAAAAPALRRLRPSRRLLATLAAIGWLVVATRAEPSVLRAGAMAVLGAVAFVRGRPTPPLRILAVATAGVVVLDPLVAWSVGLWLSVGATAGVVALSGRIAPLLVGPPWLRGGLAATLGAQIGVAAPSLMVFGRLPIISIIANLAAVPVAGVVMAIGVPCAVLAGLVPPLGTVIMLPCTVGTSWVRAVARLGAAVEPPVSVALGGWVVVLGILLWRWWAQRASGVEHSRSALDRDAVAG